MGTTALHMNLVIREFLRNDSSRQNYSLRLGRWRWLEPKVGTQVSVTSLRDISLLLPPPGTHSPLGWEGRYLSRKQPCRAGKTFAVECFFGELSLIVVVTSRGCRTRSTQFRYDNGNFAVAVAVVW